MGKERYVYNTSTLSFEKEKKTAKQQAGRVFGFLSVAIMSGVVLLLAFSYFFPSPIEENLRKEISQLEYQYVLLDNQMDLMGKVLDNVQDRDANVHRMIFGMDPIDGEVWNGGQGGFNKFKDIVDYGNSTELIKEIKDKSDKLALQLTIQSKSIDTMLSLASESLAASYALRT